VYSDTPDILDDFGTPAPPLAPPSSLSHSTPETSASQKPSSSSVSTTEPEIQDEDFTRQLQEGMEQLILEMDSSPTIRADFENLVKQMSDTGITPSQPVNSFSETLSRTMDRIQESETSADKARDEGESAEADAFLAEMLRQLEGGPGGDGAEAGMANLLEGMMEQLMSKEILYQPMKDLKTKVRSSGDSPDQLVPALVGQQ
jgi:peroxin-19